MAAKECVVKSFFFSHWKYRLGFTSYHSQRDISFHYMLFTLCLLPPSQGIQTKCIEPPIKSHKNATMPPMLHLCPQPFNASLALHLAAWVIFIASSFLIFIMLRPSPPLPHQTNKSNATGQHTLSAITTISTSALQQPTCPLFPLPALLQRWQIDKRTVLSFFAFHLSNLPPSILPDGHNAGALSCGTENAALN